MRRHRQRTQQRRVAVPLEARAADDSPTLVDHEEPSECSATPSMGSFASTKGENRREVLGLGLPDHGRAPGRHRSPNDRAAFDETRQQHPPFASVERGARRNGPPSLRNRSSPRRTCSGYRPSRRTPPTCFRRGLRPRPCPGRRTQEVSSSPRVASPPRLKRAAASRTSSVVATWIPK